MPRTDRKLSRNTVRGVALSVAMLTGVAPAAADMRYGDRGFGFGHHGYERIDYRSERREIPRGCNLRARASGWCYGERVGGKVQKHARRQLRAREDLRHPPRGTRIKPPKKDRNSDVAIALGIAGIAAGALIAGSIASDNMAAPRDPRFVAPRNPQPTPLPRYGNRDAFPPAPTSYNAPVAPAGNPYEPWSAAWLEACRERYRSFNARTGTFRGYDGRDHFCTGPR